MDKDSMIILADFVASISLLTLPALITMAVTGIPVDASLGAVPTKWYALYMFVTLMSATKLYGKSTLKAVRQGAGKMMQKSQNP